MNKPDVKFYGLVRDKDGKPKIDGDPNELPQNVKDLLTDDEKRELRIK